MFSRLASELRGPTNALYRLRDELAAAGAKIVDLVSGNVNEHGIVFPGDLLESILVEAARPARIYRPDPLGRLDAREAVAGHYRGLDLQPESIVLTPGTSLSYLYAFKLLADPGDEILAPSPSYPLFDYIAALAGVRIVPYPLVEGRGWRLDLDRLDASVTNATRAVVVISPHNPTGSVAAPDELDALAEIARRHDLAIVSDEVFSDFLIEGGSLPRPAATRAPLVLTLNGFSKMFALPGLKLGWIALSGDAGAVGRALAALELISDTFLPVSEVAAAAAPAILRHGAPFRDRCAGEIRRRWAAARPIVEKSSRLRFVAPAGGFYLTAALEHLEEERAAEELLRAGLLVHPGHFYDIPGDHLVVSFVQEPGLQSLALTRLVETLERLPPSA
jgi:hypothetical protein